MRAGRVSTVVAGHRHGTWSMECATCQTARTTTEECDVSVGEATQARPRRRSARPLVFGLTITTILALLFGVPWWTLVGSGAHWPAAVVAAGTVLFLAGLVAFPVLMYVGHGRRRLDWAAATGDTILGVI